MKKRILVAGSIRSGSTWLYNVTRMLCAENFGSVYGAWVLDYDEKTESAIHVVKAHSVEHVIFDYDFCLTSHRDLRDVVPSLIRMGWVSANPQKVIGTLDQYIRTHGFWKARAGIDVAYELILSSPRSMVRKVATCLQLDIQERQIDTVLERVANLTLPQDGENHDAVTQLHPQHISNERTRIQLSPSLIEQIQDEYADWQNQHGYF